ncbi:acylphosphatase-1-like [Rhynchophorus ferrugineus]|uniref:Acylphosphatase-like domain-containing protein n=1 Tax=Rhynchophorus ferrugineus TaxID=354439 RepID=A0A834IKA4_RHYFE|nr:hypothetical protein GWI33_005587 [Rhynchophorus ferrugineus]
MPSIFSADNLPYSLEFEIWGLHHGPEVCELTLQKAKSLRLRGYVTEKYRFGITGEMQGFAGPLIQMKRWLLEGPGEYYKVSKAIFKNSRKIDDFEYKRFKYKPNYY